MSARPWKITGEALAVLEREASLRAQCTPYKELARRLNMTPSYVAKVIWHLSHGRRNIFSVSRESKIDIEALAAELSRES